MKKTKLFTLRNMTKIAILTAISAVIMLFEFPLPFAPSFYELDLSEAVILMGGFAMGPMAAVMMELLKNLLNLLMNGTITAGVLLLIFDEPSISLMPAIKQRISVDK